MKKNILLILLIIFCILAKAQITTGNFATRTDFSIGSNGAINIATGDMDGDGKKDVVVANQSTGVISIFKNTSTSSAISFASRIDSTAAGQLATVLLTDFDNDGKLDIVLSANTGTSNFVVVYRNISTPGNILIAAKQIFSLGTLGGNSSGLWTGDLDADGKPDIAVSNYSNTSYSVLRNTSVSGTINFATAATTTISVINPSQLMLSDMDADGKLDMIIFINGTNVLVYRNTTTTIGSITFSSTPVTLSSGSGSHRGDIADVDGDGKLDIACSNFNSSTTSVFRNTGTSGIISFATKVDFAAAGNIQSSLLKDLDLDGKPELIQSTGATSPISIYRNYAGIGSINASSFGTRMDFSSAAGPTGLNVTDLDGDGKPEILSANFSAASFSVFKNDIVPSNGLVAYYPMNGNAGDSSGFGNHGTVNSGVTSIADRFSVSNNAYHFDGTANAYITIPSSPALNTANMSNVCVSAWFRISVGGTANYERTIFQFQDATNTNYVVAYDTATSKIFYYNYNGPSAINNITFSSTNTLTRGVWHHIVLRIDSANNTQIFVNNVLWGSSTTAVVKPTNPQFIIGRHPVVTNTWNYFGDMDEIRIYNRYITNTEIAQLYNLSPFTNTYYSKSTGYLDSLSTWGTNTDGTGTPPPNFSQSNSGYIVKNNSSPTISSNWIISGTNTVIIFGDGTTSMSTSIPSGLMCGADSIYVRNNATLTVLGSFITNKPAFETGSTVQYIASGAQTMQAASYSNLVVSGATKTLGGNTTVRNTLAMIANINCNGYALTLGSSATQTGSLSYSSGTIIGNNFSRWFAASTNTGASSGLFPVGTVSQYYPVQVEFTSAPTTGGMLTATFTSSNPGNSGLPLYDFTSTLVNVNKVAPNGFWTLIPSGGIAGGTYTTTVTANGFYGITAISGLRLIRRSNSSSAWSTSVGTAVTPTGTTSSAVVARSGITSPGGDFGIGADSTVNPLPVQLINFSARLVNENKVELNWETVYELNNDRFEIERADDKGKWSVVGNVKGNGTTSAVNSYQFADLLNFSTNKPINLFYHLKQFDFDGDITYSNIVSINLKGKNSEEIQIFPNPATSMITINSENPINLNITNTLGQQVYGGDEKTIDVSKWAKGIYFIQSENSVTKFIVE